MVGVVAVVVVVYVVGVVAVVGVVGVVSNSIIFACSWCRTNGTNNNLEKFSSWLIVSVVGVVV